MLRNKEFRRFAVFYLILTALGVAIAFIVNLSAGITALLLSIVLGISFYIFTKARYHNLARISKQIDIVLHSADRLEFGDFEEGELSILHNEITKMTLRIREQNDALIKDKQYLSDSLADIAHQLRTPLTSVNLLLSFLAKKTDEEERQVFVREAEDLLVQMDWLITTLLKISRLDAGVVEFQSESISVNALVQSALKPLLISLELRNIDLRTDIQEEISICGDSSWLSEAIQNVLKNCMESVGEKENGIIEITYEDNPLFTELTIRDNGEGFIAEDLPRLFDRFYRGKGANASGSGIGLALCKMIVSRHGGSVTAKNHPHGGAMFAIRFPKVTNQSPRSHRDVI